MRAIPIKFVLHVVLVTALTTFPLGNAEDVCEMTDCLALSPNANSNNKSPCSTPQKPVNATYEEIIRDACTTNQGTPGKSYLCCKKDTVEGQLITTLGAEMNEFPHMAKLRGLRDCGGTIYNKKFIITAAHCVVRLFNGLVEDEKSMEIVLGTNSASIQDPRYVYKVKTAIPHPGYSFSKQNRENNTQTRFYNDIALLELNREINFSDNEKVKVLEIAPKNFNPLSYAKRAIIAGWGTTETGNPSIFLQKANFLIRSDNQCYSEKRTWSKYIDLKDQLLCLGGIVDGQWSPITGAGDSGGPAICRGPQGTPVLCGVTSFGGGDEGCIKNNDEDDCSPSTYAEVSYFHDWIVETAGPQPPMDSNAYHKPYLYGKPVSKQESVHQVHVTSTTGKSCGGTLIANDIMVTAAQCVWDKKTGKKHTGLKVIAGIIDFTYAGVVGGTPFGVKADPKIMPTLGNYVYELDVKKQGNRVRFADNYYRDDIAIVKLDSKIQNINENNLPILPKMNERFEQGVEYAFSRLPPKSLVSRDYKILDGDDCQRRLDRLKSANLTISLERTHLLCGVEKYSGGSTCDRELGGGLICKGTNGRSVLCGVQVLRLCEWSIPNAFVNVAQVSNFVQDAKIKLQQVK